MIGFDEFMESALYGPDGFYASGRGAGRRGADFITSPELGPLFGAVIANALDGWWDELGRPDPYVVIEAGAGRGALRDAVVSAVQTPVDYVTVEFNDPWPGDAHVVLANELLDNLPCKIVEHTSLTEWREVCVDGDAFVLGDVVDFAADAPVGARVPWHTAAQLWVERACLSADRVVLFDYGTRTTAELAEREWLRTYRAHGRGGDPLAAPGSQDITTDVAFDQLSPDTLTTQAEWLRAHGVDALVAAARVTWTERAAIGDLEALKARSRVNEAEALLDPDGLGGFLVAEYVP
jgi:SAM-dependent MidA family methyltransferase